MTYLTKRGVTFMMGSFSRRTLIRAASFLTAAFVVLCGLVAQKQHEANQYRQFISNSYQHAFAELTGAMEDISASLQKGVCVTSPSLLSTLCTQVFGKAMAAQMAMGQLPYANIELEQTAAFVSTVGDYSSALARSATLNGGCTEEQLDTLEELAQQATELSARLTALQTDVQSGTLTLDDVPAAQARLAEEGESGEVLAGSAYETVEQDFPDMPTLIYDGPFSSHLDNRFPLMLEGREMVDEATAQEAAAAFLGLKPEVFTLAGRTEGELPTYVFSAAVDGGQVSLEVTQQGGQILSLTNSRTMGAPVLTREEAVAAAREFLESRGYGSMRESYFTDQGGVLIINFASTQDDIICYPDLIKVSVALDTGGIVGFEARGYLMNHTARTLDAPTVTLEQAQAKISTRLNQLSHQLAVIPTSGEYELLCWEFKCETDSGQHVILYLNAQTGQEEKIFLLLEDENGTLVL